MEVKRKAPRRIAQAVLNSLKGGVVPRIGLPYVTVGRKHEIDALLHDIEIIGEGGASFRFIMGRYGSGKSFLLQTIRNYAMDRGFAVADGSAISPPAPSRRAEPLVWFLTGGSARSRPGSRRRAGRTAPALQRPSGARSTP